MFTLEIHHHGRFMLNPEPKYIGGKVDRIEDVDPDFMSILELRDVLKSLKLPIYMQMHYRVSDAELRCITNDVCVLEMFGMYRDNPHIVIYVGDLVSNHSNCSLWENMNDDPVFGKNMGLEVDKQGIGNEGATFDDEKEMNDGSATKNKGVRNKVPAVVNEMVGNRGPTGIDKEVVNEGICNTDSDGTYYEESEESTENASDLDYFLDGDSLSDGCGPVNESEVDKRNFPTVDLGDYTAYAELISEEFRAFVACKSARKVVEEEIISDNEIAGRLSNSSDNEDAVKFPEFNEEKEMKNPNMIVGLLFPNVQVYRKALRMYSIIKGFELKFKKNDGDRVTAICQNECGWKIYASLYRGTKTFQIKSIEGTPHRCPWSYTNKSANSTWLAEQFLIEIADDPQWRTKGFKKAVKNKFRVRVSGSQAYRARRKAMLAIQGEHKNQYLKLRDYCATIIDKNPGSAAILLTDRLDARQNPIFKRLFVMYKAQIDGFIEGCRPVIGLDACHLKGKFGGHLMSAVGRDANNQMYPIAMACVESECKESWCWFLDILVCHIGTPAERGWIFISDRQKGLVETFDTLFPGVEHRFCVRHLYANFKLRFKGKALRDTLWAAARAYLPDIWHTKMRELQRMDSEAHKWLSEIPCSFWARFTFNPRSKCDLLCNNISECFNQYISNAREEPILSMLETIRRQIMCRFQEKREWIAKVKGNLCPRIQDKLEEIKTKAFMFEPILAGQGIWELPAVRNNWVVNLNIRTCTCKEWDLTGIPCIHACAAILQDGKEPADFVHPYYSIDSYRKAYRQVIMPLPSQHLWVNSKGDPIDPPSFRRRPGRPKKLRKRSADEEKGSNPTRVTRKGTIHHCSNCAQAGHTIKKCTLPLREKTKQKSHGRTTATSQTGTNMNLAGQSMARDKVKGMGSSLSNIGRGRAGGRCPTSRGRGKNKGRAATINDNRGPYSGFGNWNGIGLSTGTFFTPAAQIMGTTSQSSENTINTQPTYLWKSSSNQGSGVFDSCVSTSNIKSNIQVQTQKFGSVMFSSQTSVAGRHVHQDK